MRDTERMDRLFDLVGGQANFRRKVFDIDVSGHLLKQAIEYAHRVASI